MDSALMDNYIKKLPTYENVETFIFDAEDSAFKDSDFSLLKPTFVAWKNLKELSLNFGFEKNENKIHFKKLKL
jgi:hypothetical protein